MSTRVTLDDIEANIASEHYFTAAEGCAGHCKMAVDPPGWVQPLNLLTFCVLVLRNGFTVTGESACVSPENFDAEIGRKVARQHAVDKMWPLLGYELRTKLAVTPTDYRERVRAESDGLRERITKLEAFLASDQFSGLDMDEQDRLQVQLTAMCDYADVLTERIAAFQEDTQ